MSNRKKPQFVNEVPYGVYVWEVEGGKWVGDDQGNYLMSPLCMRGNVKVVNALTEEVKSLSRYAYDHGKPIFLAGRRPVTDEEYEEQVERYKAGKVPDKLDLPAHLDERRRLSR